jgi:RNA polymerase sigma factor (sigma-70 family)
MTRLLQPPSRIATDAQLARRATGGDDDAYAALYARYQPRLEAYCRSIVRNDEDARDAVQNAMTKALVALRRDTSHVANVQAWLFRIAHNESVSVLRRRRPTSELADDVGHPGNDPASDVLMREELSAVLAGVRDLPGRLQQPLLLRELAGLSYGQVAAVTGGTPAAARKAVFDARLALSADREGRDEACSVIRQSLSEGDYRRRRARIVRSHLRVCGACRAWEHDLSARRRQLLAAFPAGAAGGSLWAWLGGLLGTGSSAAVGVVSNAKVAAAVVAIAAGATVPVVAEQERDAGADGGAGAVAVVTTPPARTATAAAAKPAAKAAAATPAVAARAMAAVAAATARTSAPARPRARASTGAAAPRAKASEPPAERHSTAPDRAASSPAPRHDAQPAQWATAAQAPAPDRPAGDARAPWGSQQRSTVAAATDLADAHPPQHAAPAPAPATATSAPADVG